MYPRPAVEHQNGMEETLLLGAMIFEGVDAALSKEMKSSSCRSTLEVEGLNPK